MHSLDLSSFNIFFSIAHRGVWSDQIIIFLADYLPYAVAISVIVALIWSWRKGKNSLAFGYLLALLSGGVARGIAEIIRFSYHHPRPPVTLGITPLLQETSYSFPSGHALFFFALAAGVYFINKKFGVILYVLAIVIGLARIAAGVHWPSDILGGAIIGVLTSWIIFRILKNSKNGNYGKAKA